MKLCAQIKVGGGGENGGEWKSAGKERGKYVLYRRELFSFRPSLQISGRATTTCSLLFSGYVFHFLAAIKTTPSALAGAGGLTLCSPIFLYGLSATHEPPKRASPLRNFQLYRGHTREIEIDRHTCSAFSVSLLNNVATSSNEVE